MTCKKIKSENGSTNMQKRCLFYGSVKAWWYTSNSIVYIILVRSLLVGFLKSICVSQWLRSLVREGSFGRSRASNGFITFYSFIFSFIQAVSRSLPKIFSKPFIQQNHCNQSIGCAFSFLGKASATFC